MENKLFGLSIAVAIAIMIGVIFVSIIADETSQRTLKLTSYGEGIALVNPNATLVNETAVYTVTNAPTGWEIQDCPLTSVAITNKTGSALTPTTDYIFDASAGTFTLVGTDKTKALVPVDNKTYVTYTYCGKDYVSGWAGTVTNMVPGFFALALLLVAAMVLYFVLREKDIL